MQTRHLQLPLEKLVKKSLIQVLNFKTSGGSFNFGNHYCYYILFHNEYHQRCQNLSEGMMQVTNSIENKSATRILSLLGKLSRAKRDSHPVADYLHLIKSIAEDHSMCGSPVTDVDLVVHVLPRVGLEFWDIVSTIHDKGTIILLVELEDKLLSHEYYLKHEDPTFYTTPITSNHIRKGSHTRSLNQQKQGNWCSSRRLII